MSIPSLDSHTIGFVASLLYVLLPLGVWFILRKQDDPVRLGIWVAGNIAVGLFISLAAVRHGTPLPTGLLLLSVALGFAGTMLRALAMHHHLGESIAWPRALAVLVALMIGFEISRRTSLVDRAFYVVLVMLIGSLWLCAVSSRLGRVRASASAHAMSMAYGCAAILLSLRIWNMLFGTGEALTLDRSTNSVLLTLVMMFTAAFGNIAYIGITLEGVHARELTRQLDIERLSQSQRQSQAQSERLLSLLRERDEMLNLLAHEVRQPLNNASAALQSTRTVATEAPADLAPRLVGRLDRARNVIQQITSILDNTLAATTLLSADGRLALVESDLETLVELCLADIMPSARLRILVEHDPGLRTAAFDLGLMRLALRNLLVNALAYSPSNSSVVLRLSEREEPLAIVFEVSDQGRGIAEGFRARAFERGVRGPESTGTGLGLGLYIVRRVAELHRGTVEILPGESGRPGAHLRLTIPQDRPI
ncbi:HAMP domain-containing histidine kinase [Sphaerotilus montanus]|uniref:histidine kinase n=1 Tax=Sphaerotilus montanus TaxID=522889 RepID=A0A7Y9R4K1_9BURK|nr:HAMP domain-containing sensor histidine kinase [Sphaerotilus montanus]NYG35453.1 signal transduction histidine kinase [Sphaerotilus montanus]NZD57200.1 HAMP domain-containing histidine kinase [Sphaerotilus montanus]